MNFSGVKWLQFRWNASANKNLGSAYLCADCFPKSRSQLCMSAACAIILFHASKQISNDVMTDFEVLSKQKEKKIRNDDRMSQKKTEWTHLKTSKSTAHVTSFKILPPGPPWRVGSSEVSYKLLGPLADVVAVGPQNI